MQHIPMKKIIEFMELQPHPEGGYFAETYRSDMDLAHHALPRHYGGTRSASTAIHFLLPEGEKSHLHRIKSDEIWHFHLGGPMLLVEITPRGVLRETVLGPDILNGQKLQHVVPAGSWFGGYPLEGAPYTLVGCTVSPGFDFDDFELARRDILRAAHPEHAKLIDRMTLK